MKKLVTGLLASMLLANAFPAFAGHWERDWHYRQDRHYGPPAVRDHAPIVWGLAGLALGTVLYNIAAQPVVAAPAVVVPSPPPAQRMWYYCEPLGAYYPNVPSCPEAWRPVPAY